MSMIGRYKRISTQELDALLAQPDRLLGLLYPEAESEYGEGHLDIDKSWHAIHFLLNDDPWQGSAPLHNAILGGAIVSDEDMGYGPARYLTAAEVEEVAEALQHISEERLWMKFDPEQLQAARIYPHDWQSSLEELEYLTENYRRLKQFFRDTAEKNGCLLLWLA